MTENGFDPGTLIGRNEFDSLSHNYDFSLIFHHITSTDQEHCQLAIQKIDQILNRVYINEVVFHVLYECCRMNSIAAAEYINILGKIYEKRGVPPPPFYNDSKQVITADYNKLKSDEVINSQFQYTQWSQSINMGGYHFEYMIMSIFVGFLSWNSLVLMVFQTPSQGFAVQGQDISEVFIAVEKLQTLIIAQMATLWLDMSKERGRYAELRAKKMNRNRQTTAAGGDNELILISSDFSSATEAVDAVTAPVLNKSSSSSSSSASSSVPSDQKSSASNITGTKTGDGNAEDPEPSSNTTTELSPSDIYLKSTIEVPHVIRIASGMLRCIGTWIPLLLQPLLMHIASKSTAKSATGGAKGGSSGSSSGSVMSPAIASSSSSGSGNGVVRGKTQFAGIKGCPQAWLELPIMDTDSKERVRCAELVIQFANCFIKLLGE